MIKPLAFSFVLLAAAACATAADKPNVVFILVDDMGYGDPGCYNAESKIPTPNIDALAAAGMRFTDAHASGPLCHMSRYGLMTGQYPFRTNVNRWRQHPLIEEGQETIASLMQRQGYRTAMVGKWHCGFEENGYDKPLPGGPVDVGFDSFFGIRASTDIPPYFYIRDDKAVAPPTSKIEAKNSEGWTNIQGEFWRAGGIAPGMQLKDVLPRFTQEAVEVIQGHKGNAKPLMMYLAYPAPHTPWLPSPEFIGKSKASMYGDFMVMVDAMIGKVLASLESAGMKDDTLVVFSSDNGPVWYEEDVQRFGHDSSGGLRGMKADAWECGHRMPFIARWPGRVKAGSVSNHTISFVDMLATLSELTGATLAKDAGPDSFSFAPQLLGTQPNGAQRESLALKSGRGTIMYRKGDWKYINQLGSGGFTKPSFTKPGDGEVRGQLYNLAEDLGETENLYAKHPELVKELSEELEAVVKASGHRLMPKH